MKLLFTLLVVFINMHVCAQQKEFNWLIGTWKIKDKPVFEQWSFNKEQQILRGVSYRIKNAADTVVTEQIVLKAEGNIYYYIPDVAGDQGPVRFKITQHDNTMFVAENSQHDFPKIIRYKLVKENGQDVNEASIEGDGKVISYTFVRLQ